MAFLEDFEMDPNGKFMRFFSSRMQVMAESNYCVGTAAATSVFDCLTKPSISIHSYLERIVTFADCSPTCFVVAYIYLDRFSKRQPSTPITSFSVHRLILTSILAAAKFMDGIYCRNDYFARIGGINSMRLMNRLEKHFLFGLGFNLNISRTSFDDCLFLVHREMLLESPPLQHALGPFIERICSAITTSEHLIEEWTNLSFLFLSFCFVIWVLAFC